MEQGYSTWNIILIVYSALCMVESQFPPDMFPPVMTELGENSPVLDISPLTVTVTSGETAVLPCSVQNPGEAEISWLTSGYTIITTGDTVVTNDVRINVNTSNPGGWNLMIKDVLPSDEDEYKCMLQTFPPQTKNVQLIVLVPPSIDKERLLERYLFQKGKSLIVLCKAEGNPKPSVKWYAYKTQSSSMEEIKVLVSSSSTLVFERLKPSDGGIYRCEAENDIGKAMYEIFLQEVYEPKLTTAMKTVGVKEHATTVLQCEIESNPSANVGWQRNGTLLRSSFKYQITMFAESDTKKVIELTIKNTEMSDSGDYLCLASNKYGSNNIRFYVIVEAPTTTTQSTTTTTSTTTTATTTTTTEVFTTRKTVKPPHIIQTEESPGKLAVSTTPSEVRDQYPDSPKTGASHNTGFMNTQSCTLILSSCAFLLLFVL